jgi:uncharacterized membrane protein (UPF0127 family)
MTKRRHYAVLRRADHTTVCEHCLIADTALARMKGLLGKGELPVGEGILIRPCNSIHMFFMRFAIDAIFLDRDGTVLKIAANLKPWRMAWARGAHAVVDLAAGEAQRRGIALGEKLEATA